ncbi:MAG: 50S ribosomal protein L21 [Planctomycetes bacterium]|nr:50S ribosomal protein L21 [Planctomycetota bacterium]
MHAIIEDSGTQIQVSAGDVIDIDPRDLGDGDDSGKTITFDRVLLVGDEATDGPSTIGAPYVDGATVTAEILDRIRGEKLDVIKFKRRKGYRVKQGHRQPYLRVRVTGING